MSSSLPINQVRKGQRQAPDLDVEPEAEDMQGHLRRQARPKACEGMRPLMLQTEGLQQAVVDGLRDLARCCLPPQPQETTSSRGSYGAFKAASTSFACSHANVRADHIRLPQREHWMVVEALESRDARAAHQALERLFVRRVSASCG